MNKATSPRPRMILRAALGLVLFGAFSGCANEGPHRPLAAGGAGGVVRKGGGPGFAEVQAVFAKNCNACHPSKQPADWMNYETAKAGAGILMRRVVVERTMPQKGSAQESAMTEAERGVIAAWVKAGAPKVASAAVESVAGADAGPVSVSAGAIESCVGCHGLPPAGPTDGTIPRLTGQNHEYLVRRLNLFKHSDPWDQSSPMNKIAFAMDAEQIRAAAAAYTHSGPALNTESPVLGAARAKQFTRGEAMALENCVMCHMNDDRGGRPNDPLIPALAGQNEGYIKGQLYAYRTGARRNAVMNEFALGLTDADIDALAIYFANVRGR